MSFHFEFALACDLKPDTPRHVLDTLQYMTRSDEYEYPYEKAPDHLFFEGHDWTDMLQHHGTEPRFPGIFGS